MAAKKTRSLRKAINAHCRSCVYDPAAAGSWRAQVTLCPCTGCELYEYRPTTQKIPESVYRYYGVAPPEITPERLKNGQFGRISEGTRQSSNRGSEILVSASSADAGAILLKKVES